MSPSDARELLKLVRRHLWLASFARWALLAALGFSMLGYLMGPAAGMAGELLPAAAIVLVGLVWASLSFVGLRQMRAAAQAAAYAATGRLDLAEARLRGALGLFSLYGHAKVLLCHNLAVVAHGQNNFLAAAELCDGILSLPRRLSRRAGRICRIMLADCRLSSGDIASASKAIAPLDIRDDSLSLAEQLLLLPIHVRCHVENGNLEAASADLAWKVRRCELLDTAKAGLVHRLLGAACRTTGRDAWADFLDRRAELYQGPQIAAAEAQPADPDSAESPSDSPAESQPLP